MHLWVLHFELNYWNKSAFDTLRCTWTWPKGLNNTLHILHYYSLIKYIVKKKKERKQTFRLFLETSSSILLSLVVCVWVWEEELWHLGTTAGVSTSTWGSTGSDILGFASFLCCSRRAHGWYSSSTTVVKTCLFSDCVSQPAACDVDCAAAGLGLLGRWRGWCSLA